MPDIQGLYQAVLEGDDRAARAVTEQALAAGVAPLRLVNDCMVPAMAEVGRRFECSEYFLPELLLSARAMKAALEVLRPLLAAGGARPAGRVVLGTVQGDLHDIGKSIVAAMLEGAGYEVIDLGVDVAPEEFAAAVRQTKPDLVGLSALLPTTRGAMRTTLAALERAGLRRQVKVLVGGAAVSQRYAEEIGADGYCESAAGVVALARRATAEATG
jgi:5-methyltetrahydrofolate--homocysteine methyltransferase